MTVLSKLFNRGTLIVVFLLMLSLLLWVGGPMLALGQWHPLESDASRWGVIALLWLTVPVWLALKRALAWHRNRGVVSQLVQDAPGAADLEAVQQRFAAALQTLRQTRFGPMDVVTTNGPVGLLKRWGRQFSIRWGGRYLYELPWYLIIGAPGSGKTTALCHAGLQFPLAGPTVNPAETAVAGVGGTRHCDWWFTDQAVLIDTAGRFTTQDSDSRADQATWAGFMALLKKSRPRQPLNGVLMTVSVVDLLTQDSATRLKYAQAARARLQELYDQLGMQFPIYLLVTKVDLLAGFTDYFATLDKGQRADPWGFTFDFDPERPVTSADFERHFEALIQRLDAGLIERLQSEPEPGRRSRIYHFPAQLMGLREVLRDFIETVFAPSSLAAVPWLRGVYGVSGTQEGTPIDRLLGVVARQFGLERAMLPPNQASGRSYFLHRLLTDVVFAEQALAGVDRHWVKRRDALMLGAWIGLILFGLIAAFMSVLSYRDNRQYLAEVDQQAQALKARLPATSSDPAELLPLLDAMDATRQVAETARQPMGWGLSQQDKLGAAARSAYERMLTDAFWPRLAWRIELQLRERLDHGGGGDAASVDSDLLYELLRDYLMLHDIAHADKAQLRQDIERDWDLQVADRRLDASQRSRLGLHWEALLAQGSMTSARPQDESLVGRARSRLSSLPLPQRIYGRIRRQGLGVEFPDFTVARAAGSTASLIFTRASGAALTQGVVGLYTFEGYHRGFQRQLASGVRHIAEEQAWVLGHSSDLPAEPEAMRMLVETVRKLYLADYAATWEALMADLRLLPITSVTQAIEMARVLSSPDTPLLPLLREMARQTTLAVPLSISGQGLLQKAQSQATDLLQKGRDAVADLKGQPTPQPAAGGRGPEQQMVDDRFIALRQYVSAPEGSKPPIEGTVALIAEVHGFLNAVDTALKSRLPMPPSEVPNRLKAEAGRLPVPIRSLVDAMSSSSARAAMLGIRQALSHEIRTGIGEFCQQAIAGRYPFDRRSSRDVTPADLATLFAPGGKFDRFVQERLQAHVDTGSRPWRFLDRDGQSLGSDAGTLPQFQRAAAIRDAFFPTGNTPALRVEFKPVEMDSRISQLTIDVDGQMVRYTHGPLIPMAVQWPGPRGSNQIRIQAEPAGGASGQLIEGPWALLRLFESHRLPGSTSSERFRVAFEFEGRRALFEITASSVRNPFTLRELAEFSCPQGL